MKIKFHDIFKFMRLQFDEIFEKKIVKLYFDEIFEEFVKHHFDEIFEKFVKHHFAEILLQFGFYFVTFEINESYN